MRRKKAAGPPGRYTAPVRYNDWLNEGKRVAVRDRHLFVVDKGKGPALLFLHGFPTCSHDFTPLLPMLEKHFRLVLFDFLGFGDSDKPYPYDYSLFEQADFTEALMRRLGLSEAFVVAHDMGATVAQELVRRGAACSFRINGLLLMNAGLVQGAYKPMLVQRVLRTPLVGDAAAFFMNEALFRLNFESLFVHPPGDAFVEDAWAAITRRFGKQCYARTIRYMDEREEWNNWWLQALARSETPVELVWGMQDEISGPAVAHGALRRVLRARFTPLGQAGHYPQIEEPGRVAQRVLAFLD